MKLTLNIITITHWCVLYFVRIAPVCYELLYPQHTKFVEGYIVFVFPSVRPSFRASVHLSIQVLTFYVKVLREVFLLFLIFLKAYPLGCLRMISVTSI